MSSYNLIIVISLTVFCVLSSTYGLKVDKRIIGGKTTTISHTKYLVNLRRDGKFICGGTVVSAFYIVSAAHCVKGLRVRSLTVQGGTSYLTGKGKIVKVQKIFLPTAFTMKSMQMDVSVLKLRNGILSKNITPIQLCSRPITAGSWVRVSGWGLPTEKSSGPSNQVRTVKVRMLTNGVCHKSYRRKATITRTMMCASVPGRKDACSGDSGGPLIYKGQLCGIVSWGFGCGRAKYPGVYTSVRAVKTFIQNAMKK